VPPQYAINHLTCFLARVSTSLEWNRLRSDISDEIKYLPTLYPGDSIFALKRNGKK
jgi:cytochrome P450 family 710 subfamily A protein